MNVLLASFCFSVIFCISFCDPLLKWALRCQLLTLITILASAFPYPDLTCEHETDQVLADGVRVIGSVLDPINSHFGSVTVLFEVIKNLENFTQCDLEISCLPSWRLPESFWEIALKFFLCLVYLNCNLESLWDHEAELHLVKNECIHASVYLRHVI